MYTSSRARIYNRFDFVALYTLLIGLGSLPVFVVPGLSSAIGVFKSFFAIGVIVVASLCWIVARLLERHIRIPKQRSLGLLGLFVLSALISSIFAPSAWFALNGDAVTVGSGVSVFVFGMYFFLGMYYLHTHRAQMHLATSLVCGTSLALIAQVIFFILSMPAVPAGMRVNPFFSLLGSTDELGILAAVAIVGLLFTFEFFNHSRRIRILSAAVIFAGFCILLVVHSWSLWCIVMLGSIAVFVRTIFMLSKEESVALSFSRFPIVSLLSIFISIPFVIQNTLMGNWITHISGLPFAENIPSVASTISVLGHSLRVDPLFGVGPMHFTEAWFRYMPSMDILGPSWAMAFDTGVSFLFTLGITQGLVGLVLFIIFLATLIGGLYKSNFILQGHGETSFGANLFALLSGVFVLVLLLQNPGVTVWYIAAIVFAAALSPASLSGRDWSFSMDDFRFAKGVFVAISVIGIIAIMIMGTMLVTATVARVYATRAVSLFQNNKTAEAYNALGIALSIDTKDIYYRQYVRQVLAEIGMLTRDTKVVEEHKREINALFANAVSLADRALAIDPKNYQNILIKAETNTLGISLGAKELYSPTQELFDSLAVRMPKNAAVRFSQARLVALVGNSADQEKYLSNALGIKPNFTEVYLFQAQSAYRAGDLATAAMRLEVAAKNDPQNATVLLNQSFVAFRQGNPRAALAFAEVASSLPTDSILVSFVRAYLYAQLGDIVSSRQIISSILRISPNNSDALLFQKALDSGSPLPSPFGEVVSQKEVVPPIKK